MVLIESITAEQTLPIRQSVLRPGRPVNECNFDGDNAPQTFHLGAFIEEKLVGLASFVVDPHNYFSGKQYRLRGMAVLPEYRGKGYGKNWSYTAKISSSNKNVMFFGSMRVKLPLIFTRIWVLLSKENLFRFQRLGHIL